MEIRLNPSDGLPVYRQIVNQVKYLIASGRLGPGQELPPIRVLAERLVINPNTVVHAYGELDREGVVVKRHGSGTYVAEKGSRAKAESTADTLVPKVDSLLADAAHLDLGVDEVIRLICDRYARMKRPDSK